MLIYVLIAGTTLSLACNMLLLIRTTRLLEAVDDLYEVYSALEEKDAESRAFQDLNSRLADIQKSRFAYMGSSPRKRNILS